MKTRNLVTYYYWMILLFSFFIVYGFITEPFDELVDNFIKIVTDSSVLLSDYLAIGGMSATLVNAGILGLACVFMLLAMDLKPNGSIFLSIFLVFGFAFFGKNVLNIWPIFMGVYVYSRYKKHPFKNYIIIAFMGTSLAPAVNQIYILITDNVPISILLSTLGGMVIGFILPSIVSHCLRMHEGFILANAGFASGFIAIVYVALFKSFGFEMATKSVWSSEYTSQLAIILVIVFGAMLVSGIFLEEEPIEPFMELNKESGRIVTDFFILYGNYVPLVNIGFMGLLYTVLTLVFAGELNGPFVAGIFTVAGFAGFGLNVRNVSPITFGAILAAKLNLVSHEPKSLMLTILLGTSIAPFSGYFGAAWGVLAGFIHMCLTLNVGIINAGINLYNNGFVAGLVVVLLLPIASSLKEGREHG